MDYSDPVPQPSPSHDAATEDASMHTVTASSVNALPHIHNHNISDSNDSTRRPQTSYSDTGFTSHYQSQDNPDAQQHEDQMSQYPSRPSSRLNRQNSDYSDQNAQRQQAQKNASVVIKVGMVGDAQIGKTSLMVKYVEGSWDEDYIQTLGAESISLTRLHNR